MVYADDVEAHSDMQCDIHSKHWQGNIEQHISASFRQTMQTAYNHPSVASVKSINQYSILFQTFPGELNFFVRMEQ
jgi:hypothetical protein